MIQNDDFKLISYGDGDILYDLKNDPDELTNVVSQHPEIARMLRAKKDHWLSSSGEVKPSVLRADPRKPRTRSPDR
ncbi:MAG: hypothetical protein GY888_24935 [Planctomycetaceae bacterium]|nr:hypothetical protein [Planctomycetaceae bacterium]